MGKITNTHQAPWRGKAVVAGFMIALAALAGCTKHKLAQAGDGKLEVTLDWGDEFAPTGARLYIYDSEGNFQHSTDCAVTMQTVELPAGDYRLIVHNTDAVGVGYTGMEQHGTAEVYALGVSENMPAEGEMVAEPCNVYGIGSHDQGESFTIRSGQSTGLNVVPVSLTKDVAFYFDVTGLEEVEEVSGKLHGVAPSMLICTGVPRQVSCSLPFTAGPYVAPAQSAALSGAGEPAPMRYTAMLTLFDMLTREDSPQRTNYMDLTIKAADGKTYTAEADITAALQEIIADNDGVLPIDIPLEVTVEVNTVTAEAGAVVMPWNDSGSGSGRPRPAK